MKRQFDVYTGEAVVFTAEDYEYYHVEFVALSLTQFNFVDVKRKYEQYKQSCIGEALSFEKWLNDECICVTVEYVEWHDYELP